jgi:hypothetical protein
MEAVLTKFNTSPLPFPEELSPSLKNLISKVPLDKFGLNYLKPR